MPIYVVAKWVAGTGHEEEIAEILPALSEASRAEPGCLSYQPVRSLDDPRTFVLFESYSDESALERHKNSDHYRRLVTEGAVPLLDEREVALYREV
jgi:quinol monooxygenase YgiN